MTGKATPGAGLDGPQEVLRGAELDDLQSLFAEEMQVTNSPMGCPTEISPVLIPVKTRLG